MAMRMLDGFEHYATSTGLLRKWTGINNTSVSWITGRIAGSALRTDWNRRLYKSFDAQATWIVGTAFRFSSYPSSEVGIISLTDAGSLQTDVRVTGEGKLRVTRNGTSLGLGSTVMALNAWYYIELKVTINSTTGVAAVRINGVSELNLTNQNTQATANASANEVRIGGLTALTANVDWDDIYICDGTGGTNNDFLGDIRVETLMPNGNGNSSQLVGSDGNSTDNYLLVDESDANDDTDYVESSTVGNKDTYTYGDLASASGTVHGLQCNLIARKTDAGTRQVASVARLSATETDGTTQTLGTSYLDYFDIRETKPGGGSWSISDVNSAEFGMKIVA